MRTGHVIPLLFVVACAGAGTSTETPRVKEGARAPSRILVALPASDASAVHRLAAAHARFADLEREALSWAEPTRYPQPDLDLSWRSAAERAVEDLVDPFPGVTVSFDPAPEQRVETLVVVEMLPEHVIRERHGSDAFTQSIFDLDAYHIRRAVIRLPLYLLDERPDDFANFLAHEFGHALGEASHVADGRNGPADESWFWDRLMAVPIRLGQPWQPATSEDILLLARNRYRLRDGWITDRLPRFAEVVPTDRRVIASAD